MRLGTLLLVLAAALLAAVLLVWGGAVPLPFEGRPGGGGGADEGVPLSGVGDPKAEGGGLSALPEALRPPPAAAAPPPVPVAARPGASVPVALDGQVVRADGRPAVGVLVQALSAEGALAEARADGEGRFRLELPRGVYDLLLRSPFDGALLLREVVVDGRPLPGAIELAAAADLRVEVSRDAAPVGGALARARLRAEAGPVTTIAEGATDGTGAWTAQGLPPGRYDVEVVADGVAYARRMDLLVDATTAFALPPSGRLTGRVTDARSRLPVPAEVSVTVAAGDLQMTAQGSCGGDGVYDLAVPRGRPVAFTVSHPDYAPFPAPGALPKILGSIAGLARQPSVVRDAALEPGAVVRGAATEAITGLPVEGLALRFTQDRNPVARTAETGEDGSYEVRGLGPGVWRAGVESAGWYPKAGAPTVRVPGPSPDGRAPEARLDLVLLSSGVVTGQVVLESGAPAAGARVWLVGGGGAVRGARQAGRALETLAGPDGRFSLDDVPPLVPVRVRAALGASEATPAGPYRLADGPVAPVRLVLGPTVRLSGRVTDMATGAPVRRARVTADPVGEPPGRTPRAATTDAEGRYAIDSLLPGAWSVSPSRRPDYVRSPPREVRAVAETAEATVDLLLDPGLSVGGVVVDDGGRPLQGARVTVVGTEDAGSPPPSVSRAARVGPSGAFLWTGFAPGRYELTARRDGFVPVRMSLRGGEARLTVVLAPRPR